MSQPSFFKIKINRKY